MKSVTLRILVALVVVYILQLIIPGFTLLFGLDSQAAWLQPWRFVTSIFLHSPMDFSHILFNGLVLFFMGLFLERLIGKRLFLIVFLSTGVFASLAFTILQPQSFALGASGALMGVTGTLIYLKPKQTVLLWGIIPMPLWGLGILLVGYDLLFASVSVAVEAHLAGIIAGLFAGWLISKKSNSAKKRFTRTDQLSEEDMMHYMKYGRI